MAKGIQAWAPKKGKKNKLAKPGKASSGEKGLGGTGHVLLTGLSSVGLSVMNKKMTIPTPLGDIKPDIAALIASGAVAFIGKGKKARVAKSLALGAAIAVGNRWAGEGGAPLSANPAAPKTEKARDVIRAEVEKQTAEMKAENEAIRAELSEIKELLKMSAREAVKATEDRARAA